MTQEPSRGARQLNVTLPRFTLDQIEALCAHWGMTKTQLVIVAIERMAQDMERGDDPSVDPDAANEASKTYDASRDA